MPVFKSARRAIRYLKRTSKKRGYALLKAPRTTWRKRRMFNPQPTFTETFRPGYAATLSTNTGTLFYVNMNMMLPAQLTSYSTLYNQYCIRKLQVIIIPRYTNTDINVSVGGVTNLFQNQYAYSIVDTPDVIAPGSMNDVLQDNGCRISTMGTKPLRITCRPKPSIETSSNGTSGGAVAIRLKGQQWFNFNNTDTNPTVQGQGVNHAGISLYLQNNNAAQTTIVADVYYKLTFSLRDPK